MFNKVPLLFINQNILLILSSEKYFEMLNLILYHMPEFSRNLTFPTSLGFLLFRVSLTNWIINGMYSFIYINSIVPVCFVLLWALIFSSAAWKWISVCLFSKGTVKGRAANCLIKIFVRENMFVLKSSFIHEWSHDLKFSCLRHISILTMSRMLLYSQAGYKT